MQAVRHSAGGFCGTPAWVGAWRLAPVLLAPAAALLPLPPGDTRCGVVVAPWSWRHRVGGTLTGNGAQLGGLALVPPQASDVRARLM